MQTNIRHPEILAIARRDGRVSVEPLARHFDVTEQTIRRDLTELAQAGQLDRVHGGAVLPSSTTNIGYHARQEMHAQAKQAIARTCARDIPNDVSVFLNIGTTTEAVARHMLHHRNLLVVTNNMNVAQILSANPEARVIVTGGTLRRADGGLVGRLASDTARQFKVDVAVIGCSALDDSGDILDFDIQEVGVARTVIDQSRRAFLVADHSKFQRSAPARIASLSQVEGIYTDAPLPAGLPEACARWNTRVVLAQPEDAGAPDDLPAAPQEATPGATSPEDH